MYLELFLVADTVVENRLTHVTSNLNTVSDRPLGSCTRDKVRDAIEAQTSLVSSPGLRMSKSAAGIIEVPRFV